MGTPRDVERRSAERTTSEVERPALRLLRGGASNSRPSLTSEKDRNRKQEKSGIDTVRLRHRDEGRAGLYEQLRRTRHQAGARGEVYAQRDGVRWGAFPDGLGFIEGRVAAILDGPDAHYLAQPGQLVDAAHLFADTLGVDVHEVVIGRIDLASELSFEDGREGLALLRTLSALDVPWLKTGTEGSKRDGLETVAWRSVQGRSVQLRAYDKGVESETAAPGEQVRVERQRRMRKGHELVATSLPSVDLGALYVGRELRSFVASDYSATVCNTFDAIALLNGLQAAGRVQTSTADLLAGFVSRGRRRESYSKPTWYRRWAALRQLGIYVDDQQAEVVTLPISRYFGQLVDAWAVAA